MSGEPCADPYLVRWSRPLVEAWSAQRLPFEPKGWLASFRADIRAAVQTLQSGKDQVLHAVYASRSADLCDAENILFYNVGPAYFASAARHGVRFERSYAHPAPPSPRSSLYLHHHRYAVTRADETFTYWTPGQIWARWRNVEVPALNALTKATAIWYRMKSGPIEIVQRPAAAPGYFGLKITIAVPISTTVSVAALLKPLLDGVVAAFHAHNGAMLEQLSQRLGVVLQADSRDIANHLCHQETAVLGQRCLLWPRGQSVQWNPADDRCLAAEVLLRPYDGQQWRLSGKIFAIAGQGHSGEW